MTTDTKIKLPGMLLNITALPKAIGHCSHYDFHGEVGGQRVRTELYLVGKRAAGNRSRFHCEGFHLSLNGLPVVSHAMTKRGGAVIEQIRKGLKERTP